MWTFQTMFRETGPSKLWLIPLLASKTVTIDGHKTLAVHVWAWGWDDSVPWRTMWKPTVTVERKVVGRAVGVTVCYAWLGFAYAIRTLTSTSLSAS